MSQLAENLSVIAFTGGHNAPSRVPRVQSYIPSLEPFGVSITEAPSHAGLYPPRRKWMRPIWGMWNLLDRIPHVVRSHDYDAVLLQREMLSTFVTLERFTRRPRILDVDDAIWVHRGGQFARKLAGMCDHVICGNSFLAAEFSKWNSSVSVLPTPVDTDRFSPPTCVRKDKRVIGWLGLSSGYGFLYAIKSALREVLRRYPDVLLRIISNASPRFLELPASQVEYIQYQRETEVALVQEMSVGIMPLDDSVVARGKCSFKMLQYMACAVPVVVSPVGMNAEVLQAGNVGLGAANEQEWIEGLSFLLENPQSAARMGQLGHTVVLKQYSVKALAPRLASILQSVVRPSATQLPQSDQHVYS